MTWQVQAAERDGSPRVLQRVTRSMRIMVHRHCDYPPETWLVSVHGDIHLATRELASRELEAAKKEAVLLVRARLELLKRELEAAEP